MSAGQVVWVVLASIGAFFTLISAVGVLRMPDVYTRMHAASKSATLGASCLLLAAAVHFAEGGLTIRIVLSILFLFLTAPVAAHVLARSAYLASAPLAQETVTDDLAGRYDTESGTLASSAAEPEGAEG